jgi:hypothetical protein
MFTRQQAAGQRAPHHHAQTLIERYRDQFVFRLARLQCVMDLLRNEGDAALAARDLQVRSMPTPACSFHRQVRGIAIAMPAAATKWAMASPSTPASWPHAALPSVVAPKIAVRKMARPRARTPSGNGVWVETYRIVQTIVHEAPATMHAKRLRATNGSSAQ